MGHHDHARYVAGGQRLEGFVSAGRQLRSRFATGDLVVDVAAAPLRDGFGKLCLEVGPEMALKDAGVEFAEPLLDVQRQADGGGDHLGGVAGAFQRARPDFPRRIVPRRRGHEFAAPGGDSGRLAAA